MSRSSDKVYVGPGSVCDRCGQVSRRYQHGPEFIPFKHKGFYLEWNLCVNPACRKTMFVDKDTYVAWADISGFGSESDGAALGRAPEFYALFRDRVLTFCLNEIFFDETGRFKKLTAAPDADRYPESFRGVGGHGWVPNEIPGLIREVTMTRGK